MRASVEQVCLKTVVLHLSNEGPSRHFLSNFLSLSLHEITSSDYEIQISIVPLFHLIHTFTSLPFSPSLGLCRQLCHKFLSGFINTLSYIIELLCFIIIFRHYPFSCQDLLYLQSRASTFHISLTMMSMLLLEGIMKVLLYLVRYCVKPHGGRREI